MTEETQAPEVQKLTTSQAADFKRYYAGVVTGIMASIPFGVNIDPNAVASAAKNTALAMVETANDIMPEEPEQQSNFSAPAEEQNTKELAKQALDLLIERDRGVAADTLSVFGVADFNKLESHDLAAFYCLALNRLAK